MGAGGFGNRETVPWYRPRHWRGRQGKNGRGDSRLAPPTPLLPTIYESFVLLTSFFFAIQPPPQILTLNLDQFLGVGKQIRQL